MANVVVRFLEAVGKDFAKGFNWAMKYAIPVEKLVGVLFPDFAPATAVAVTATGLVQSAVVMVEQKYAASGVQNGTGAQKLAEVLTLTQQAVTSLLAQAGITVDTAYMQNLVSAVVAILNMQTAPTGA